MSFKTAVSPSILDNDFYKFTMQNAVIKLFPYAKAQYRFINRGEHPFPEKFATHLRQAIDQMADLQLSQKEKDFLQETCPYLDPTYLDFLQGYRYDPAEVVVEQNGTDVSVIIEGYWYRTILWEVPVMALISELYYQLTGQERENDVKVIEKVQTKVKKYKELGIQFADFGTRRRHSLAVQDLVVRTLQEKGKGTFIGTSNVYLAMKYDTKPIGTHAHEWFMFHAAKYGYKMANVMGLEHWVDVYRGDLGIALTDTFTTEVFFDRFDKKFAKLFDGVRHDSGDAIEFGEKTIAHYKKLGIDPLTKTIIFSDGLNYEKVERIASHFKGKIGLSFGIGTSLTNDVGLQPMNIVIKMIKALPEEKRWTGVIKLSDEPQKHTGKEEDIELSKRLLQIK
ncbi:nicotinate phosphoribosyltransferase [Flavobacterium sp. NRK F10]|uniref:nicotinate phosphoribosyltransferase n=1 Tax=Flavobacterium sp. NRK F10 TaxID=2954931 RepID=UPI002090257A|nr:nicotinate phosphoribosyltransferase [Flavobacterium sp. NRK F10]MCO6173683.1 nicotinate phosphoribosyltransferase [Flavobacterium sp. NRK F10]